MASSRTSPPRPPATVSWAAPPSDMAGGATDSRHLCRVALRAFERTYRTVGGDPDFATNIDYVTSRRRLERRAAAQAWDVPEPQARRIRSLVRSVEAASPASLEACFGVFTETVLRQLERRQALAASRAGPRRRAGDLSPGPVPGLAVTGPPRRPSLMARQGGGTEPAAAGPDRPPLGLAADGG